MLHIAIDGPAGAGKSTVARAVAARLCCIYVDTGALYRAIALYMHRQHVPMEDKAAVIAALPDVQIRLSYGNDGQQTVTLNSEDVSAAIRENIISGLASKVSAIAEVRSFLLELQRSIARENSVIMDGRDIGTVILPDAEVKIFMFASPEARAKRRYDELCARGQACVYDEILAEINARDHADRTRAVAPTVPAEDAVMLDNTGLSLEESVEAVLRIVADKGFAK